MIPAAEWKPDLGLLEPQSTSFVMNVVPAANGWRPFLDLATVSLQLPAPCVGGCYFRTKSGSYGVIAGTATKLYRLDVSVSGPYPWVDISTGSYAVPPGDFWQFEKFGDSLYACSLGAPLQKLDIEGGGSFVNAPGSPPRSKFIKTIGDFLVLANLQVGATLFPNKWANSGINAPDQWTVGNKLADEQTIPAGDEITGLLASIGGGRVLQRHAKQRLVLSNDVNMPIKMGGLDLTHGIIAPYATVPMPGDNYICIEEDGFFLGDDRRPISVERVTKFFFETCAQPERTQGIADPNGHMAWWLFKDMSGKPRMLGWDWDTDRWTQADPDVEYLMASVTPAVTLEMLTNIFFARYGSSSIDTPGAESFDSPSWRGGNVLFSAVSSQHQLGSFTAQPREAFVDTTSSLLNGMARAKLTGCFPISDSLGWRVAAAVNNQVGAVNSYVFGPYGAQNRIGRCPLRGSGRLVRFRANAPYGLAWKHFHGIEPISHPGGAA